MKAFISKILGRQLARPSGLIGIVVGKIMHAGNADMYAAALPMLDVRHGDVLLEIGFGNGDHIRQLVPDLLPGHYFGTEASATMLAQAQRASRSIRPEGHVSLRLVEGDRLPFEPDSFDRVLTVNTIYFWKRPEDMTKEIFRVLKPGGRVVVTCNSKAFLHDKSYARETFTPVEEDEVTAWMAKSGFIRIHAQYARLKHQDALSISAEKPKP
jgi:ubiquinone/menaquinone biosynthesis C-methylase UbiE